MQQNLTNDTVNRNLFGNLKAIYQYMIPYKKEFILMMVSLVITSFSVLIIGKSIQYIIDNGISSESGGISARYMLYMVCLVSVFAFGSGLRFFLITYMGEKIIADVRTAIYNKILSLSSSFFEQSKSGDILSRLTTDTTALHDIVGSQVSLLVRNTIMFVGSIIMLAFTNFKLTLVMIVTIPMVVLPMILIGRRTRHLSKVVQESVAEISSISEETINHIRAVQSYVNEKYEQETFLSKMRDLLSLSLIRIRKKSLLYVVVIMLSFTGISVILFIGGMDVVHGRISSGELLSFIFLAMLSAVSGGSVVEVVNNVTNASGIAERIQDFLSIKPDIIDSDGARDQDPLLAEYEDGRPIISLRNVTFCYPSRLESPVMRNFSLDIPKGKVIALVGPSGTGKSTIFQMLLRFYNIADGEILINGHNAYDISIKRVRQCFSYVSQDASIFSTTVLKNIEYGRIGATREEVVKAAQDAAVWDFIEGLPSGLDTYVGEKGLKLSGGQKQRISVARALLRKSPILLLDEATSALDRYNEKRLQDAIKLLMRGKTTIVITHRIATIQDADSIVVMKGGKIIAQDTYDNLMDSGNADVLQIMGVLQE